MNSVFTSRLRARSRVIEPLLDNGLPYSRRLCGHTSCVNALTFSYDGQLLASGGDDCIVYLWDFHQDDVDLPMCSFTGPHGNIFNLAFSARKQYLISGGTDMSIFKFDIATGTQLAAGCSGSASVTYQDHADCIRGLTCHSHHDELFLSASDDGSIRMHDGRGSGLSRAQGTLQEFVEITDVRFHPTLEHNFVSTDSRGGVHLRDMRMAFGPLTQRTNGGIVQSYNTTLSKRGSHRLGKPEPSSVVFNRDGDMLAVTLLNHLPTLYSLHESQPIATFSGSLLPDGSPVPSNQRTYCNTCTIKHGSFGSMGFESDGFYSAGSDDFRGYLWKVPGVAHLVNQRRQIKEREWGSQISPSEIAFVESESSDRYIPLELSRPYYRLTGHDSIVNTTLFHPYLPHILTSGIENHITLHSPTPASPCSTSLQRSPLGVRILHCSAIEGGLTTNDPSERESIGLFDRLLRAEAVRTPPLLDVLASRMKSAFGLAILAATLAAGLGHNDWSKPCFNGECAYDLPDHRGQSGTIKLMAKSPHAIADITPAAGWVVLDCDPNALSQDIRLVCQNDDTEASGCSHFFEGSGPMHKYVRLPESCSSSPFARISKYWVHDDQSIGAHHQVTRRDGVAPQVLAISIDDKFDQADHSLHGDIDFIAYGITEPGIDTNFAIPDDLASPEAVEAFMNYAMDQLMDKSRPSTPTSPRPSTPGFKFTKIDAYIQPYYFNGPPSTPPKIDYPSGKDAVKKDDSGSFGSSSDAWRSFEIKSEDLQCKFPVKYNTTLSGGLAVTGKVDTFFWGKAKWGGVATGKNGVLDRIFGFFDGLEAHMRHELSLNVALTGKFGWEVENPPWGIPGVTALEFGLAKLGLLGAFKLEGSVSAEASLELTTKLQYGVQQGVITIPPKSGSKLKPYFNSTEVGAKYGAAGKAKAAVEFALTPKLMLGAAAGGGKTTTVNGFVGFEFKLSAEVEASKTFAESSGSSPPSSPRGRRAIEERASRPSSPKSPRPSSGKSSSRPSSPSSSSGSGAEVGYCVKFAIDGHVGGEAKFWGMGPSVKVSFWTWEFVLAQGGDSCKPEKRSMISKRASISSLMAKVKGKAECPDIPLSAAKTFIKKGLIDPKKWKVLSGK
ncbi:hypothetical protein AB1N83_004308 [Pleurotus pulmonarius]